MSCLCISHGTSTLYIDTVLKVAGVQHKYVRGVQISRSKDHLLRLCIQIINKFKILTY